MGGESPEHEPRVTFPLPPSSRKEGSSAARSVLVVEPIGFAPDEATADDNAYQLAGSYGSLEFEAAARDEFHGVVGALREKGIEVVVFPGDPACPDGAFPNNWFSTHSDGRLVLYPMKAESRRPERREEIVSWLRGCYPDVLDLTVHEADGRFLEGTGSMVLDRRLKVAYAARSKRTDEGLVREWSAALGYQPLVFDSLARSGQPVYHTNVLLAIGADWAVACPEVLPDAAFVVDELKASGRKVVKISEWQLEHFCGNLLELSGSKGPVVVMSRTAYEAFESRQLDSISWFADLAVVDVPTIECVGGGGVRCMLAELW